MNNSYIHDSLRRANRADLNFHKLNLTMTNIYCSIELRPFILLQSNPATFSN